MGDFKRLMGARFFFNFAVRMQAVIVGWRMYALTQDPLKLGFVGLAEALPALSIAVFAGYLVDRRKPIGVYRGVQLGSLLSTIIVCLSQRPGLALGVHEQVLALYVASVVTGAARGFSQPAMYAIVPRLLERAHISKASAWLSSALQMAAILGPAVGGLVFGYYGASAAAVLPVLGILLSIFCLYLVRADISPPRREQIEGTLFQELFSGARFVWNHPILLPALSLDMISVLFGGVTALLPIYAADILHIGAEGLGVLRAGPAAGSMLVSFALTKIDMRARAGTWLLTAVAGFGLCMLTFGLSESFYLSLLALMLGGCFDSVSVVVRSSAVQLVSPDNMRGRISAINAMFIGSSNELGEFESGVAAKLFGAGPAVTLGALACLATVALLGWRSPALRRLNLKTLELS